MSILPNISVKKFRRDLFLNMLTIKYYVAGCFCIILILVLIARVQGPLLLELILYSSVQERSRLDLL